MGCCMGDMRMWKTSSDEMGMFLFWNKNFLFLG